MVNSASKSQNSFPFLSLDARTFDTVSPRITVRESWPVGVQLTGVGGDSVPGIDGATLVGMSPIRSSKLDNPFARIDDTVNRRNVLFATGATRRLKFYVLSTPKHHQRYKAACNVNYDGFYCYSNAKLTTQITINDILRVQRILMELYAT